ncbi:MAG: hypothetical protein K2I95_08400, partial [Treponemataceae bacterium]|nr:hypothetical protein [Treponemataceae bacterium]
SSLIFSLNMLSPRLSRRVFNLRENSRDFPGVFSTLKSTPVVFLVHFQRSKVLPKSHSARFVARRYLATKALSIWFKQKSS